MRSYTGCSNGNDTMRHLLCQPFLLQSWPEHLGVPGTEAFNCDTGSRTSTVSGHRFHTQNKKIYDPKHHTYAAEA